MLQPHLTHARDASLMYPVHGSWSLQTVNIDAEMKIKNAKQQCWTCIQCVRPVISSVSWLRWVLLHNLRNSLYILTMSSKQTILDTRPHPGLKPPSPGAKHYVWFTQPPWLAPLTWTFLTLYMTALKEVTLEGSTASHYSVRSLTMLLFLTLWGGEYELTHQCPPTLTHGEYTEACLMSFILQSDNEEAAEGPAPVRCWVIYKQ